MKRVAEPGLRNIGINKASYVHIAEARNIIGKRTGIIMNANDAASVKVCGLTP
jgi:hypothetical protein